MGAFAMLQAPLLARGAGANLRRKPPASSLGWGALWLGNPCLGAVTGQDCVLSKQEIACKCCVQSCLPCLSLLCLQILLLAPF